MGTVFVLSIRLMFELVIGLEIHLKINSEKKLFCACRNLQDFIKTQPNSNICPVCTWQPWSLPVLQRWAVEKSLLLWRALKCSFNNPSLFDRKSYFYPDLPLGYQITQFYKPYGKEWTVSFYNESYSNSTNVGIHALQIETDTAKTIHDGDDSFIDFNRACTPLVEIVTKPDFRSADEVTNFLKEIQRIARFNNIGDADLEKWQMRVDVNLSIRPTGQKEYWTRVEIKNINTFSNIKAAIHVEYARQLEILQQWDTVTQQTRRWDAESWTTILMRSKEDALDYRYFPEPDLPPLLLDETILDAMNTSELVIPADFIQLYVETFGFHKEYINVLIGSPVMHRYFHAMLLHDFEPKSIVKWLAGPIAAYCKEHFVEIDALPFDQEKMIRFLRLIQSHAITNSQAKIVMKEMLATGDDPDSIVSAHKFDEAWLSEEQLMEIISSVIQKNPDAVSDYQGGKDTAIKFLMWQVMRDTKGQVPHTIILEKLTTSLS